jgi:hypothetical protein
MEDLETEELLDLEVEDLEMGDSGLINPTASNLLSNQQWAQRLEDKSSGASDFLDFIKADLAIRPDNPHFGSGLGGNASEFLFLLSHDIKPVISYTNPKKIGWVKNYDGIEMRIAPKNKDQKRDVKVERNKLSSFIKQEFPDTPEISFEKLVGSIPTLEPVTTDIKLLKQALQLSDKLVADLQHTLKLQKAIKTLSDKEEKDLRQAFGQEFGEVSTKMIRKHPIYGPKLLNKENRFADMERLLLSETDLLNLKTIDSYPFYISTFCLRMILGIDLIVSLNLDEHLTSGSAVELQKTAKEY